MYTTCLFCHGSLGANEEIEPFPVGRRLAFDEAKGRLWVVCQRCARWNLSPLEERWEAVEECERRFRASPLRAFTDNVGLTRLPGGLELVRVGSASFPEVALWRYGRRFRWRRRMVAVREGAVNVASIGALVPMVVVGGSVLATVGSPLLVMVGGVTAFGIVGEAVERAYARRTVSRLHDDVTGRVLDIRARDLPAAALRPAADEQGWALRVVHRDGAATLTGRPALRAAGMLLSRLNQAGAEDHEVRVAARRLATLPDPRSSFGLVAAHPDALLDSDTARRWQRMMQHGDQGDDGDDAVPSPHDPRAGALARYPKAIRIALEMAAHEESERRAMEGELAALEAEWREAEEIAAIADDLLLPASVTEWLRRR